LLANWIATSLRPFSIVEDSGFRDFVDFLCNLNKQFFIPGRKKVRNHFESYGELVREKMQEKINNDINNFSATTDIWSSRTMQSFMTITLHALSKDFQMINMTLEIDPLEGRHTGEIICTKMSNTFKDWNLEKKQLVLMLRDNASNAKKLVPTGDLKALVALATPFTSLLAPCLRRRIKGLTDDGNVEILDDTVDYDRDEVIEILDTYTDKKYKKCYSSKQN